MKKVIEAEDGHIRLNIKKIYSYRSLIVTLAQRDIRSKYAQTLLGVLWSLLEPLTGLLIYTLFFGLLLKMDTGEIPYPLFAFSGLVAWNFFSRLFNDSGSSLIYNQLIIKKIYFPKLILPLSKVLSCLVELFISLGLLFIFMFFMGHPPGINVVFIPFFILFNIMVSLSLGIWLSALTIRYRDFHQLIPYITRIAIWITPVFYPTTLIPERFQFLLYSNPMAGVIEGFRWSLFGGELPSAMYALSLIPVLILFFSGLYYFRKIEGKIVDYI